MTYLSVVNWDRYQDYQVDDPHYIKLHISILDDKKVQALDPLPRLLWYQVLALAGRYQNSLPFNVSAIAKETKLERHSVAKSLQILISKGLVRETQTPRRPGRKPPRKLTGWRLVRGSHAASYVPDPRGTDRLPKSYRKAA